MDTELTLTAGLRVAPLPVGLAATVVVSDQHESTVASENTLGLVLVSAAAAHLAVGRRVQWSAFHDCEGKQDVGSCCTHGGWS